MGSLSRFGHFVDQKTWDFYPACNGCNDELDRNPGLRNAAKESAKTPGTIPASSWSVRSTRPRLRRRHALKAQTGANGPCRAATSEAIQ